MHGLTFKTAIVDSNSSAYQFIDNRSYREQMTAMKKIECTNHLLRNYAKN